MSSISDLAGKITEWRDFPGMMVRDLFGIVPDTWQDEALAAFPHAPRLAMQACAGPGKTAVLSWIGWNFLLTRPHPMIGATSISGDNLKSALWPELARWRNQSPLLMDLFEQTKSEIFLREHAKTWRMEARTWAKDADATQIGNALAGLHAKYVMWLLDETGDYPESIMPVCEGIFNGNPTEAHIVQAGNPTKLGGPLWRAATVARNLWKLIRITADPDDPNRTPRVSVEIAREQIAQYGRDNPWILVRIFGQFPPSSFNSLIGPDEVEASFNRIYREDQVNMYPMILGVDVAREGDDASVIFGRIGKQALIPRKMRNIDSTQGAGLVSRIWQDSNVDACFIDATGGFGSGWIDQLRLMNRSPIGIHFSAAAHESTKYYNKRAEMYFDAIQWIKEGGALPRVPELLAALTTTTYTFSKDRLLLEPKEDVKLKLGYSPDDADAFCFVGNTEIATPEGAKEIRFLRVGDEVLTPFGTSRIVKKWVRHSEALTTVDASNGTQLVGRPEHEIFVYGRGKVELSALSLTMGLSTLSERHEWLSASALFTEARSIGFKTLVGISPRVSLFTASACCIGAYGLSAMVQFRQVMKYITEIATGETATSTTWNSSLSPHTPSFIAPNGVHLGRMSVPPTSGQPEKRPRLGTRPQKASNGIDNTAKKLGLSARLGIAHALSADGLFKVHGQAHSSVQSAVGWHQIRVDILRTLELAHTVAKNLLRAVTARPRVVPVGVRTESVPPTLVYNLTLDRDNAYYANGVLVFNCLTFAEPVTKATQHAAKPRFTAEYDPYQQFDKSREQSYGSRHTSDFNPFGGNR